jgi:hypothetical protein
MSSVHIAARQCCFDIGILTLGFQSFIDNSIQNFTQTHNAAMVMHWKHHRRYSGSRASNLVPSTLMSWSVSDHGYAIGPMLWARIARRLSRERDRFWFWAQCKSILYCHQWFLPVYTFLQRHGRSIYRIELDKFERPNFWPTKKWMSRFLRRKLQLSSQGIICNTLVFVCKCKYCLSLSYPRAM